VTAESGASPDEAARVRAQDAERFLAAARDIVSEGERRQLLLRLLGSLAYRIHCPANSHLLDQMDRQLTDLDFASEHRFAPTLLQMLKELGYAMDQDIAVATGGGRFYFKHPQTGLGVDIFMNELFYCHRIPFQGRLHVDTHTIPLAELMLEKMQIVELNEKDIKDTIVLVLEHDIGDSDNETINGRLIAEMLKDDWGFYYTVNMNLDRVVDHLSDYAVLTAAEKDLVSQRIGVLRSRIEGAPKSLRWKARARVGTKVRWYQEVEPKQ
jgi:hypothetical protein